MKNIRLCAFAACSMLLAACDKTQGLEEGFRDPSSTGVQTSVYWYWISGNVSKEGVVADLESMKRIGIDRAFIGNIGLPEAEGTPRGPVNLLTEEWYEIMHTALKKMCIRDSFKSLTGGVACWGMPNIKEVDLSKWEAKGIELYFERAASLEKFVGPPYAYRIRCYDSPKLTHVDVHNCDWLRWLEISNYETGGGINAPNSAVTYLDIRRNQSGTYAGTPTKVGEMAMVWNNANQGFNVADNATILIDSHFLIEHTLEGAWTPIYNAWKDRGATIKVYSTIDPHRDELLGTVPSVKEMPDALANANKNGDGSPANKWQVDDPYTEKDEAPGNK